VCARSSCQYLIITITEVFGNEGVVPFAADVTTDEKEKECESYFIGSQAEQKIKMRKRGSSHRGDIHERLGLKTYNKFQQTNNTIFHHLDIVVHHHLGHDEPSPVPTPRSVILF